MQQQSSNNDHCWAKRRELFTRNWEDLSASSLWRVVTMTGYWDASKLDIPMVTMMICSEQKPIWILPSQNETHTIIEDFSMVTVFNSDNYLYMVWVVSVRLYSSILGIPEMVILITLSLWCSFCFFSSLHVFSPLNPSTVWLEMAEVVTTSGDKTNSCGDCLFTGPAESLPWAVLDWCETYKFIHLHQLNSYWIVSSPLLFLYTVILSRVAAAAEGIMKGHNSMRGALCHVTPAVYIVCSPQLLAHCYCIYLNVA